MRYRRPQIANRSPPSGTKTVAAIVPWRHGEKNGLGARLGELWIITTLDTGYGRNAVRLLFLDRGRRVEASEQISGRISFRVGWRENPSPPGFPFYALCLLRNGRMLLLF